ncbi:MAG: site-specific DNA-methyltransferase [Gammaproteobacteria bacterium]|jgi:site-specific DNA-methyltransferase (adenine-specific)|nr:site-specific DNA-methyltransferase [Gammaproteobacteria bacterium]
MKGQISLPLAADPDDSASDTGAEAASYATAGHRPPPDWLAELRGREAALRQTLAEASAGFDIWALSERAVCVHADARAWLDGIPENSIHAVVTDPPYGLIEYADEHQRKLKAGRGGVWRIPPSYDGAKRSPLPRFTVLSAEETAALTAFFADVGAALLRALVPGGHIFMASNPLLSSLTFAAVQGAGLEKRGEVIRLVQTLRGGDRPKGAESEFPEVSMMPRSCWEPWGIFRKPFTGTAAANLRRWGTGGLKRISPDEPFKDIIQSAPARGAERAAAPHPSLKPQAFLRRIVRAALPLGIGTVYDPFAGSGSTLAAAQALGYRSIGTERSAEYCALAEAAFPTLSRLQVPDP